MFPIYYYVLLSRVVSNITSSNRSGWVKPPMSGVAISHLAVNCVSRFGRPSLSWRASLVCINSRCLLVIMSTVNDTTLVSDQHRRVLYPTLFDKRAGVFYVLGNDSPNARDQRLYVVSEPQILNQ